MGAKLREGRERLGVPLRQIADSTKISVSLLQALERDDISRIPAGVFGRGFVRSFAAAVGLDSEAIVADFVAQFPSGSVSAGYPPATQVDAPGRPDIQLSKASARIKRRDTLTLLRLAAVGALTAAAFIVYFGTSKRWPHWAAVQNRVATAQARSADSSPNTAPPNESAASVKPRVDSVALPALRDSTAVAVISAPTVHVAPDLTPAAGVEDRLTVMLSVTQPSWVIVTLDGQKVVNRLIEVGEQETFEARRELALTAGDAGAIVMTLNGAIARSLGPTGETATIHINRINFRNYLRRD